MWTLLASVLGVASQIHPLPIPLSAVVQSSPTIVVVEDAAPPHRDIQIPAGTVAMGTRLTRVRVLEVVRAPPGQVSVEQVIEVGEAHLSMALAGHQMYYDEGVSESPIYETYEGGAPNTGRRVLLLQPCTVPEPGPALCFSATGAIEAPENLPAIRKLLTAP